MVSSIKFKAFSLSMETFNRTKPSFVARNIANKRCEATLYKGSCQSKYCSNFCAASSSFLVLMTLVEISASRWNFLRSVLRTKIFSLIHSAIISRAPCKASSEEKTLLFKYLSAVYSKSSIFCDIIIFAKGSNPASRAVSALVFRFFLKGRYKSSISTKSKEF